MNALTQVSWPVIVLVSAGALLVSPRIVRLPAVGARLAMVVALLLIGLPLGGEREPATLIAVAAAVLSGTVWLSASTTGSAGRSSACGFALLILAGAVSAATATTFPVVCVGVHLLALGLSVLAAASRHPAARPTARESLLFQMSCLLLVLFGMVLLLGARGSVSIAQTPDAAGTLEAAAPRGPSVPAPVAATATVMLLCGLCGLSAGPYIRFHGRSVLEVMERPDLCLLAMPPVTAVLVLLALLPPLLGPWTPASETATLVAAALLVAAGGALLLGSTSLRRLSGGLLVVTTGVWLVGLAVECFESQSAHGVEATNGPVSGLTAARFLICADLLGWIGWMSIWTRLRRGECELEFAGDLAGLLRQRPVDAACATLFLLSLAGLPPLPGFWGRWWLVSAVLRPRHSSPLTGLYESHPGFLAAGVGIVIGSIVLAAAAVHLLQLMLFDPPLGRIETHRRRWSSLLSIVLGALVLFGAARPVVLREAIEPGAVRPVLMEASRTHDPRSGDLENQS